MTSEMFSWGHFFSGDIWSEINQEIEDMLGIQEKQFKFRRVIHPFPGLKISDVGVKNEEGN